MHTNTCKKCTRKCVENVQEFVQESVPFVCVFVFVCVCVFVFVFVFGSRQRKTRRTNQHPPSSSPRAVEFPPRVCRQNALGVAPSCERLSPLPASLAPPTGWWPGRESN